MTDALHERAELHLLAQLSHRWRLTAPERLPRRFQHSPERSAREFGEHVAALLAVDALTEREAQAWIARFHEEQSPPTEFPDAGADEVDVEAARQLLEDLIDTSARERGRGTMRRDVSPFEAALMALLACRAIDRDEHRRWIDRFTAHPELPAAAREDMCRRRQRRACSGVDLQDVLDGPPGAIGDLQIRCVELYADGLMVYWQRRLSGDEAAEAARAFQRVPRSAREIAAAGRRKERARPLPVIRDDLGTPYEGYAAADRIAADGSITELEFGVYTPAVPPGAMRLELAHDGAVAHALLRT